MKPFTTLGLGVSGALAVCAWFAAEGNPDKTVLAIAVAFVPYMIAVTGRGRKAPSIHETLAWTLAAGIPLLLAPPILSDDLYRYLWDGQVTLAGIDPYRFAPDHHALASLRSPLLDHINHRSIPTIYPPGAQGLFAMMAALGPHPWIPKTVAFLLHLLTAWTVYGASGRSDRAALLYAQNPLALAETALSGHVDMAAGLGLVAFAWLVARKAPWTAVGALAAAIGSKLIGLVAIPMLFRESRPGALVSIAIGVACIVPLLSAGYGHEPPGDATVPSGFTQYTRRWEGNPGPIFRLLSPLSEAVVAQVGCATDSAPGHVRLPFLRRWIDGTDGSPAGLRATFHGERKWIGDPVDFEVRALAPLVARVASFLLAMGFAIAMARRKASPFLRLRHTVLAVLLCAPQIHPWYLLWILPLEGVTGRRAAFLWSAIALISYAPLGAYRASGTWAAMPMVDLGAALLVGTMVLLEVLFFRRNMGEESHPLAV
ncbi:MAG: hypothetical protein KC416_03815 [Myxococcales bacterium]|nr:hypothetical protein [Myxococcales bacterium]